MCVWLTGVSVCLSTGGCTTRSEATAASTVANTSRTACGCGCTCCRTQVLSSSHALAAARLGALEASRCCGLSDAPVCTPTPPSPPHPPSTRITLYPLSVHVLNSGFLSVCILSVCLLSPFSLFLSLSLSLFLETLAARQLCPF